MNIPTLRARLMRQIEIERAAGRSTHGLWVILNELTHMDLRQAPQRAGRMKRRAA